MSQQSYVRPPIWFVTFLVAMCAGSAWLSFSDYQKHGLDLANVSAGVISAICAILAVSALTDKGERNEI